jgi:hypothetical protein
MTHHRDDVVRTPGGSIDFDHYRERAARERSAFMRERMPALTAMSPLARRRLGTLAAAFALASAAFWATMLVDPPTTSAAITGSTADPACLQAEAALRPRLMRELVGRRWAGIEPLPGTERVHHAFSVARAQCEAGRTPVSLANFEAVAGMLERLEARRPVTD